MTARVFVDTNVLVYARDASERSKQPLASSWLEALWERRVGRLSYQVVNEYYVTVTRKLRPGLPPDLAKADVRDLLTWHPIAIDAEMLEDAWRLEERFGLAYWDAQVVAAARVAGCRYLLTEDLQPDQELDGLTVVHPFTTSPEQLLA